MVKFVFFLDSVSFLHLKTLSDLHWSSSQNNRKKKKKTLYLKIQAVTIEENNSQNKRRTWTQNLQPTHKCALETPGDNVQIVTCPWLSLTPSQASALHMACGLSDVAWYFICYIFLCTKCKPWTDRCWGLCGALWNYFSEGRDSSQETPFVFSLTFLPSSFLLHPSVHLFSHSSSTDSSLLLTSVDSWE